MTITKKHFINIAKIIDDNSKYNDDDKRILVDALSNYFKSENKNFDSVRFYNACFKTFKPITEDQNKTIKLLKAENQFNKDCADQYKKSARVLQSKVKTYEQDINKRYQS